MELLDKAGLMKSLFLSRYSKPKPVVAHINITNKCNLRCKYCYGSYPEKQMKEDISIEKWLNLIDQLARYGTKRINIAGGEPLIRKDMGEILRYIRKKHIVVNMNTNGHFVKHRLDVIKKLNTLCISIDGDERAHDKSKGKGSYKKVIEAIQFAKQNKVVVHTSTLITKYNIHTIPSILEVAKKYGFGVELLFPFFQDAFTILPPPQDIRALLNDLIEYKEKGYPLSISYNSLLYLLHWPHYKNLYNTKIGKLKFKKINGKKVPTYIPCYAGKFMCMIDHDGYVYPCSSMIDDPSFTPLNFLEVGFKKAFENTPNHKCKSCYAFTTFNDYNLLINRDPSTIWNYIKNLSIERRLKS